MAQTACNFTPIISKARIPQRLLSILFRYHVRCLTDSAAANMVVMESLSYNLDKRLVFKPSAFAKRRYPKCKRLKNAIFELLILNPTLHEIIQFLSNCDGITFIVTLQELIRIRAWLMLSRPIFRH